LEDLPPTSVVVRIESRLCLSYSLTPFEVVRPAGALDAKSLLVLDVAGIFSTHPVVDATNVTNLEIGQPMHAFDADAIRGTIRVRESVLGERALPLYGEDWLELPVGTLVIADDEKILAIAGVVGCQNSAITAGTSYALLESACFDPVAVRKASKALKITTDASQRSERGADPSAVPRGARRVAHLLVTARAAKPTAAPFLVTPRDDFTREICFTGSQLNDFFDAQLDLDEVALRLERSGHRIQRSGSDDICVITPPARYWDVMNRWDIYEEIAKAFSYSHFPEKRPKVDQGARISKREKLLSQVRSYLVERGCFEVFTDSFYGAQTRSKLVRNHNDPLWPHVETLNAIERNFSLLRNNCLAQALEVVEHNLRFSQHSLRLFEICKTFHPDPSSENGVCREREIVWVVMTGAAEGRSWATKGRPIEFWDVKGILEGLAKAIHKPLRSTYPAESSLVAVYLHPYRHCGLLVDGATVGVFGEVHPRVATRFGIERARVYFIEIELAALENANEKSPSARMPPARPPSIRSLNFVLSGRIEAASVGAAILKSGPDWLQEVEIVDVYDLGSDGGLRRSVTYELRFSNEKSDHTTTEINSELERIIADVEAQFPGDRVVLRR
jgi:phenylalanyl-tRNA synthetase beta chain